MFGNAVVLRQPLVDEGVVGGQQVEHAAILAKDALRRKLRFAAESLAQVFVEVGILSADPAATVGRLLQEQPLPDEIADDGVGSRIGEHSTHLPLEYTGIAQFAGRRGIQQRFVRNAAPQEK